VAAQVRTALAESKFDVRECQSAPDFFAILEDDDDVHVGILVSLRPYPMAVWITNKRLNRQWCDLVQGERSEPGIIEATVAKARELSAELAKWREPKFVRRCD